MLVAAGFCFYWLSKSDTKTEKKSVRTAAFILTVLLVILGMAAVAFLAMGGGGIYK
jgi:putative copper export protein